MKVYLVAAFAFVLAAGSVGLSSNAWALAGGDPNATCLVPTTSSLGPAMNGTMTIAAASYDGSVATNVDATMRLQWQGTEHVFRAHLSTLQVSSDAGVVCQILGANPTTPPSNFGILQAFAIPLTSLKLNNRSITGISWEPVPASGGHQTGIGEVTIYPQ